MSKLKLAASIVAIIFVVCIFAFIINRKEDIGEPITDNNFSLSVHEEWWVSNGEKETNGTNDEKYETISKGDIIYKKMEYKLIVDEIYADRIILKQEGGLVPANEDGSLNAFVAAEDTYEVIAGEELILRSYSLMTGIRIYLNLE